MTEARKSFQKAEYVSHELTKRGRSDYITLTYKRLDGEDPGKEVKAGNFISKLDSESRTIIKNGGMFVVEKTEDGKFWPLTAIRDISTYKEKPAYTQQYTGKTSNVNNNNSSSTWSDGQYGAKVGGVMHDAVAIAGKGAKMSFVKELAEQLLSLSYELEDNAKKGKYKALENNNTPLKEEDNSPPFDINDDEIEL